MKNRLYVRIVPFFLVGAVVLVLPAAPFAAAADRPAKAAAAVDIPDINRLLDSRGEIPDAADGFAAEWAERFEPSVITGLLQGRARSLSAQAGMGGRLEESVLAGLDLDWAIVLNGSLVPVFDHFNDNFLDPAWFIISGAPGPETGTILEMNPGDFILQVMVTDPTTFTLGAAMLDVATFPPGAITGILLVASPGDWLALLVIPGTGAALIDEAGVMGGNFLAPSGTALPLIYYDATGIVVAYVGSTPIFVGNNTLLGPAIAFGVFIM